MKIIDSYFAIQEERRLKSGVESEAEMHTTQFPLTYCLMQRENPNRIFGIPISREILNEIIDFSDKENKPEHISLEEMEALTKFDYISPEELQDSQRLKFIDSMEKTSLLKTKVEDFLSRERGSQGGGSSDEGPETITYEEIIRFIEWLGELDKAGLSSEDLSLVDGETGRESEGEGEGREGGASSYINTCTKNAGRSP